MFISLEYEYNLIKYLINNKNKMVDRVERSDRMHSDPQLADLAKMRSNPEQFRKLEVKA